ncbi:MAG: proline--tRNA ligase [Candidatus Dojkabacteria bacterium]|nr:proline--tRNA ligase [Candidatus Dojkabacteria bacterium]
MKYSKLFGKTQKYSKEYDSKNATLLVKAGFIDQTMSGVFKFLPLGYRVLKKIENIIREEMDKIGQEMLLTALSPREFYEMTSRDSIDILFEARGANSESIKKNNKSYILNPTHEDNITPMVKHLIRSYKDLPICLYQFQVKFRNEARCKSGLLRCREFIMKDLYSFHSTKEDLEKYYNLVKESYIRIFDRLGIGHITHLTLASGGDFTDNYTHEFQVECSSGEDLIFINKNGIAYNKEIAPSKAPVYEDLQPMLERKKIYTPNTQTIKDLVNVIGIPEHKCIKTIIYEVDSKDYVGVVLRGDYEINENKLKKVLKTSKIRLLEDEEIYKLVKLSKGYIGIIDMPNKIKTIFDDSTENIKNFLCGANEENYHYINVNWDRDIPKPDKFYDVKIAKIGDIDPETGLQYTVIKGAEAGNIFQLDTKFSKDFEFTYIDETQQTKFVYMGSYGIGLTRLIGIIAEVLSDEKGLVWPENIAPYKYHLISLTNDNRDTVYKQAEMLYNKLIENNVEVLWDDRTNVSAGEKLIDCDLIGIPYRIVISKKLADQNLVEIKKRNETKTTVYDYDKFLKLACF